MKDLDLPAFARLFDTVESELASSCGDLIASFDFRYRVLSNTEYEAELLKIHETLRAPLTKSGPHRLTDWERGWSETRENFETSLFDDDSLTPGYYRPGIKTMRLFGEFVRPLSPLFERNVLKVLQTWLSVAYVAHSKNIYEFGCGPGHNLLSFSTLYREKNYYGLDWAYASQKILSLIANKKGANITGINFDMFNPDYTKILKPDSTVFTIGGMEQLGTEWRNFFDFIYSYDIRACIHIEPVKELHNSEMLIDKLALTYMEKRGYLDGYLSFLRLLEKEGKIRISRCKTILGNLYLNGWNVVCWEKT